jgi:two-component system, cell cycle sensor histidine kinase and response regulator CckA
MSHDKPNTAEALRRRAEILLEESPGDFERSVLTDVRELAHELAVHQAELELQNEELRDTQGALHATRDRFAALYENAPTGYVVLDAAGIVRRTNATWQAMTRRDAEDFRGRPFIDAMVPEDAPVFLARFRAFFRNPAEKQIGVRMIRAGAEPFHARIEARPNIPFSTNESGDADRAELLVIVSDISDLHEARQEIEDRNRELRRVNERLDHINRVLLGVRNVNQLIASENDPRRLIRRACENLTEAMGYGNAWIALLDEEGRSISDVAASGLDGGFAALREHLLRGEFPNCMARAIKRDDTAVFEDPRTRCPDCPISDEYKGRAGLSRRLRFEDRTYGILAVSVPATYVHDAEEHTLFDDVADDLGFALHRIEMDRRLAESRRRYLEIFEGSRDGFVMADGAGRIIDANRSFCEMLGYSLAELRTLENFYQITPERWREWEKTEIRDKRLLSGPGESGVYEKEYIRKDGTVLPVELRCYAVRREDGELDYVWGTVRDIAERKRAEEALRESEHRFRSLVENANDIVYTLSPRGVFTYISPNWLDFVGEPAEAAVGRPFEPYVHPEDAPLCREFLETVLATGKKQSSVEYRVKHRDGEWRWHVSNGSPMRDMDGNTIGYFGIARDMTESRKAAEELRKRESQLRKIFEILPIGLWFADKDGTLLRGNPAGVKIWGAEPKVPISEYGMFKAWRLPSREPIPPEDWALARTIREGVTIVDELLEIEAFDGKRKTILNYTAPVLDEAGAVDGAIVVNLDISDRKNLEDQLAQARKMESIGRLAGGVAHDFNNMLNVILGYVELSMDDLADDDPLHVNLGEVRKAALRSADLTRQLLAFARKQTVAPRVLNLNETVAGMLKMLRRLIGEDIDLRWLPAPDLDPVRMDPSQIDQILANLCVNARDAIGLAPGKITIETGRVAFDEDYCAAHAGFLPGAYVLLAVSDDGRGMEEEIRSHIFEPFYTTKGVGEGTGLGLATVYGIVKQNEGFINVYSEPGRGTTFRIYLPRHAAKAVPTAKTAGAETIAPGHETILLVEDEPSILKLTAKMLERLGYVVLPAAAPGEAIRLAREHAGDIHLLMTDVVMPEMNGRDLAENLLSIYPEIKRLFMSGYTANVIAHHGVLDEGVRFIQKPFSMNELAAKTREALGRGERGGSA